eukprot:10072259-Alexandrium_andersonii.AAC.1
MCVATLHGGQDGRQGRGGRVACDDIAGGGALAREGRHGPPPWGAVTAPRGPLGPRTLRHEVEQELPDHLCKRSTSSGCSRASACCTDVTVLADKGAHACHAIVSA